MGKLETPRDLTAFLVEKSRLLDEALKNLTEAATDWAEAKNDLRRAEAREYAIAATQVRTEKGRDRIVGQNTLDEAHCTDLAEARKVAAKAAVDARMAQLSAGQTIGSGIRAEMQMAGRYGS